MKIVDVEVGSVVNGVVQTTLDLQTVVGTTFVQYWTLVMTTELLGTYRQGEVLPLYSQMASLEYDAFDQEFPQMPFNGKAGTAGNTAAGQTSVRVTGSDIEVGRYITFSTHSKLYTVTAKSSSAVTVYPALRENVAGAINANPTMKSMMLDIPSIAFRGGRTRPIIRVREFLE